MNAKDEFIEHIEDREVLCAEAVSGIYNKKLYAKHSLKKGYTNIAFVNFLRDTTTIDKGTIWYTDGTWSTYEEYEGITWWEYHKLPEVPVELEL